MKSGYLNGTDLKFFYGTNTDTRLAIKRANIELRREFRIEEMSSISQLEFAWDNYRSNEHGRSGTQECVCSRIARMSKLEYLVCSREVEVKEYDWDSRTIISAASLGKLATVKSCVENRCPLDACACSFAASKRSNWTF